MRPKLLRVTSALGIVGSMALLGTPRSACADPQDWAFVRSVGGLRVGNPVRSHGVWSLPIRANVSGIEAITNHPTQQNARLSCAQVVAATEGRNIYVTLNTAVRRAVGGSRCSPAALGVVPSGSYTVFYRSPEGPPVRLRMVYIAP